MQTTVTREIFEDVCQAGLLGSGIPENFGVFFLKTVQSMNRWWFAITKKQYRQFFF